MNMAIYLDGLHSPSKLMLSMSEMGYKHVVYRIIFTFGEQAWEPISVMGCTLHYPKNNVRYMKGIELERDATVSAPISPHFSYAIFIVLHRIWQRHHEFLSSCHPNCSKSFRRKTYK